ncbi:MAG TPA: hypothetical protein VHB20_04940 [Verrucomicrobiae bacterium]|jgi:hypothetical protein|nr:hypothetical protein [Verrucomicrobiae bacterium]
MIDAKTLAQINGQYDCPSEAGPAWREAMALGLDMSLVEYNLSLTPWERLLRNDQAAAFIRAAQNAERSQYGSTD